MWPMSPQMEVAMALCLNVAVAFISTWPLCHEEAPHVHKLVVVAVPAILPGLGLSAVILPVRQLGFALQTKTARSARVRPAEGSFYRCQGPQDWLASPAPL